MCNSYVDNKKIIDSLLKLLEDEKDEPLFKEFIKLFYNFSYSLNINLSDNVMLDITKSIFDFIKHKNAGESKLRALDIDSADNLNEHFTVIEMVNDDMPFIVDSVIETIKSNDLLIYHYTNTVLSIERNEGVMYNILPIDGKSGRQESVVYFIIRRIDEDFAKNLIADIENTLKAVRFCVEDWNKMLLELQDASNHINKIESDEAKEISIFLDWLKQGNFVFLGYQEYSLVKSQDGDQLITNMDKNLGLQRINYVQNKTKIPSNDGNMLTITRSDLISIVHKRVFMDCVIIRYFDGNSISIEKCFFGLFSSVVAFQDARTIPIIRKKIINIEKRSGFIEGGHNNKALVSILQRSSREELFQSSEDELFDISMGMLFLSSKPRLKLFIRRSNMENAVNCTIFIPKKSASTELAIKMQKILEEDLNGVVVSTYYNMVDESDLVRLQFVLNIKMNFIELSDEYIREIEGKLIYITKKWEDNFLDLLYSKLGVLDNIFSKYVDAFPVSYHEYFTPKSAYFDVHKLENVRRLRSVQVDLYITDHIKDYQLKIYTLKNGPLQLSGILKVIKNMRMKILSHYSYDINIDSGICIHYFILSSQARIVFDNMKIKEQFEITLIKVFAKEIENDYFNSLVIIAGLNWKEVLLIRALSKYLKQISFSYSQIYIQKVVAKYPHITCSLVELFEKRFNPFLNIDREEVTASMKNTIESLLLEVTDVVHDCILRGIFSLILSILRTNYYQDKTYLSIKFNSSKVPHIPLPCPFREVYVYSYFFEGIHLRGGKVARGGIRWSDRTEDFRTEVLGLMKAQMTKNAVIVPVGSKGGFILKRNLFFDKVTQIKHAVECYQNFLRGMLDITDNIVDGEVISPKNIVRYDEDDPHLVVAADKGTASFSDYANQISTEYNFWLGDAFASGGSIGYDHKKTGITARGAMVAARRHFWEMGKNIDEESFTVVGIGDMSGDVFGNGMLLSDNIALVGAFNHIHIFIDPNPDVKKSFFERKRLFNLPSSSWQDYDKSLISKGGGVFERSAKSIPISDEMKKCFGITENNLSPNDLIVYLLKAPVDMIWNGGIGTYVKSSKESNSAVSDKMNDALRINGQDLRAAMIIEGGNLGCTQLGRIEYAEKGGRINTDFVDNSGGVTLSDFEVNIKICLKLALESGAITFEERNEVFEEMTDTIVSMVLNDHNKLETKALSMEYLLSKDRIEQHHRLIQCLERSGRLNRSIEFLPTDEEIIRMLNEGRGFNRPQLAVIISYCRTAIKNEIINSDLLESKYLLRYLFHYFPKVMRDRFADFINKHYLKREIIATCVTNEIVNRMGIVFVNHIVENTGTSVDTVVKIYVMINHLYGLYDIWDHIDKLDGKVAIHVYKDIIREVQKFVGQTTFWFFRNLSKIDDINNNIENLIPKIKFLEDNLNNILDNKSLEICENKLKALLPSNNDDNELLVKKIVDLQFLTSTLDIISLSEKTNISILDVGRVYFDLRSLLHFDWVRDIVMQMEANAPYWQRISIRGLLDDLNDYQFLLTADILKKSQYYSDYKTLIEVWREDNKVKFDNYEKFLNDINTSKFDLSKLVIIVRRLGLFIER